MPQNSITVTTLDCGMPLIVERIGGVRSVGVSWLVSGGSARDPDNRQGLCAMWSELLLRGAGDLDSRAHADALDRLGVGRDAGVETFNMRIGATALGDNLPEALPLLTDMVLRPRMDEAAVAPVRELCEQAIEGLRDDPHERVMLLAREKHAPSPINRSGMGTIEGLRAITRDDLVSQWAALARPQSSVLAAAGAVNPAALADRLNELLDGWSGRAPDVAWSESPPRGYHHDTDETNQVQIAVVHDAPPEPDADAVLERFVTSTLSGGMSSRLFSEVREKRSLCYSVSASYGTDRKYGRVVAYSGTTPERAQETLDVLIAELQRINTPEGRVTDSEFQRARIGMKSQLVMSGESTGARAGALARDWHRLGRPRSLEERTNEIESVSLNQVNDYLARRSLGALTVATVGPAPLEMPA